jgi:hypothetical protein
MKRFNLPAAAVLLALMLVSACSTTTSLTATTDFDSDFDFSKVKKIAIQPVERMNAAAIRISDMDINRLNRMFTDELAGKGFQVVTDNAEADMYLRWHLVTQEKTDIRSYNSASYYNCWRCGPSVSDVSVRQYTEGTLIVDMIDPDKAQSVWRSIVQSRLSSKPTAEGSEELRREATRALLANFPPY